MSHSFQSYLSRSFTKKVFKLGVESTLGAGPHSSAQLERSMSLFDLICIGVGATVGSGVFVLSGFVAHEYAGPGVVLSWLIGGLACTTSAVSFAELTCRMPSSGSSYTYVYATLGEWPAFIAAWCLTLEFGLSSSAIARNWGDKLQSYFTSGNISHGSDDFSVNFFAGILQVVTVVIFLCGVEIGKITVNGFTFLKLLLIAFMLSVAFSLFQKDNVSDFTPMGFPGVLRGATACLFGYAGYDEVFIFANCCCLLCIYSCAIAN